MAIQNHTNEICLVGESDIYGPNMWSLEDTCGLEPSIKDAVAELYGALNRDRDFDVPAAVEECHRVLSNIDGTQYYFPGHASRSMKHNNDQYDSNSGWAWFVFFLWWATL